MPSTHSEHTDKKKALYLELRTFWGAINEIVERTKSEARPEGYSRYYVSRVLAQKEGFDNDEIWMVAAQVLLDLKKSKAKSQNTFLGTVQEAFQIALF